MHILPVPLLVNIKNKQTKKNFFRWNIDPIWHDEAIEGIYCRVCWTFRCWRSKLQQNKIKATDFSQLLWENGMVDRKHWALPTSSVGVKSAQMWKVCYRWGTSKPTSFDGPQYWWKGERGWLGVRKYWILGLGTVDKCLLRWGQQGHLVRRLWNWLAMQCNAQDPSVSGSGQGLNVCLALPVEHVPNLAWRRQIPSIFQGR